MRGERFSCLQTALDMFVFTVVRDGYGCYVSRSSMLLCSRYLRDNYVSGNKAFSCCTFRTFCFMDLLQLEETYRAMDMKQMKMVISLRVVAENVVTDRLTDDRNPRCACAPMVN
jgi:hypothetical protein